MVKTVLAQWDKIDILVNNAGVTSAKHIFEMSDEDFDSVIRINLSGPFKCIREVAAVMKEHGGGSIINTSSMVGSYGGKMPDSLLLLKVWHKRANQIMRQRTRSV